MDRWTESGEGPGEFRRGLRVVSLRVVGDGAV